MTRRFTAFCMLYLVAILFAACSDGGASGNPGGLPTDGDGADGDGAIPCVSSTDCPPGEFCDSESRTCRPYPDGDLPPADGDIDDETAPDCNDFRDCTDDRWSALDSSCVNELKGGYCLIAGECYLRGDSDPSDPCKGCDPDTDSARFSAVPDGKLCDDGLRCTVEDSCQGGVCTGGLARDCDDAIACTDDSCTEADGCVNAPNDGNCASHEYCDAVDNCVAGGCTPEARRCVAVQLQECDPNGEWQELDTCEPPTPVCTVDGCRECRPGDMRCEGEFALNCNAEGQWEETLCLGPAPACEEGECVACGDGERWCGPDANGDWGIYDCASGEWTLTEPCDEVCAEIGGEFSCVACVPGDSRCEGLSHQVCDESGAWQIDPCPTDTPYCVDGECVFCVEGSTRCGDVSASELRNDVYICLDEDWTKKESCPLDKPNCAGGICVACNEGETRCGDDSGTTEVCDANGHWVDGPDCEGGNQCDPDSGACTDGYSLYFDGADRMSIPDDSFDYDPNAEFTLEAWVLPTALSGNCITSGNVIMEKWAAWPKGNFMLALCADYNGRLDTVRFFAITDRKLDENGDPMTDELGNPLYKQHYLNIDPDDDYTIKVGEWNHIAVIWTKTRMDMYVNGVRKVASPNWIGFKTVADFQQNSLDIGCLDTRFADYGFEGYIDEIRISKTARYEGDSFAPEMFFRADELTTGLWHLNDHTTATVCQDATGNHDGDNSFGAEYSETGVGELP